MNIDKINMPNNDEFVIQHPAKGQEKISIICKGEVGEVMMDPRIPTELLEQLIEESKESGRDLNEMCEEAAKTLEWLEKNSPSVEQLKLAAQKGQPQWLADLEDETGKT